MRKWLINSLEITTLWLLLIVRLCQVIYLSESQSPCLSDGDKNSPSHTYTLLYLKWVTDKVPHIARGILLHVMWQPGWQTA